MVMPISRKYTCKDCGYSMVKISSDCLMPDDLPPLKCPKCGNAKGYKTTKPTEFERQMQSIKNVFKFWYDTNTINNLKGYKMIKISFIMGGGIL